MRLQTILTELTRYEAEESVTAMYIEDISYGRKTGRLGKEQFKLECIADRIETKRIKVCLGYQYKNWRPHKEDKHFMTPKPDVVALKPDIDAVTDKLALAGGRAAALSLRKAVCGAAADEFVAYNAVAQAVMDWSFGVATNDLYARSLPRLGELQIPNDSHFTTHGSEVLAESVAAAIRAALPAAPD